MVIGFGCALLGGLLAHQFFGVPPYWAVLFGLAAGTFGALSASLTGMMDANWEAVPNPITTAPELHASSIAIRFAEAANDQHRFVIRVRPRMSRLAVAILRARPGTEDLTTLDDPRARDALGDELHTLLTDSDARLPSPRRLAELLARLEEA
jgi:hypothetical protein